MFREFRNSSNSALRPFPIMQGHPRPGSFELRLNTFTAELNNIEPNNSRTRQHAISLQWRHKPVNLHNGWIQERANPMTWKTGQHSNFRLYSIRKDFFLFVVRIGNILFTISIINKTFSYWNDYKKSVCCKSIWVSLHFC